ncbi:MAG: type II toxin-antitoxin system RelE/ParE family toxin [Bacteroidetes bacterium]|nr:type II toxin-antitoxin system RelE/ParE family toxin [Bacteroidota bacterium]MBU2506740.1 type II toxin-antitoxin system RelE/ParE family toxin [Bacteroidota bacterium]
MYKVVVHKRAVKYLKKVTESQKHKIKEVLSKLIPDPNMYTGVKNMAGDWVGYRRIRIGDVRIIFWVDRDKKIIYVDHIGNRGDIYKN